MINKIATIISILSVVAILVETVIFLRIGNISIREIAIAGATLSTMVVSICISESTS